MSSITAERFHDISCGHRVHGQGGKCENLHGHNYRVHFEVAGDSVNNQLDDIGRVLDFGVIKSKLCMWLEENWDHKFLIWSEDPWAPMIAGIDATTVWTPFNPTAENMAEFLVNEIAPKQLEGLGCVLIRCTIEETSKCSATFRL